MSRLVFLIGCFLVSSVVPGADSYRLYPGDIVEITVFDHPDLAADIRIPGKGTVEFPLIGQLRQAAGATIDEMSAEIRSKLQDGYIRQAVVSARVREFAPRQVVVVGSVEKQGSYPLDPLAPCTLLQAIGFAGGFTKDADRAAVRIAGRTSAATDSLVGPNDVIIVPKLDQVYVIGQVLRPGNFPISSQEALTVSKAIGMAGGFDKYAKKSQVELLRVNEPSQTIDVRKILSGGKAANDVALRPGDTVYVPESRF